MIVAVVVEVNTVGQSIGIIRHDTAIGWERDEGQLLIHGASRKILAAYAAGIWRTVKLEDG
jgi:hypothetical protein